MKISHYFLQGMVTHNGLPQWLSEQMGLYGNDSDVDKIVIWINSSGGDITAALEIINLIEASDIPVITIVNGCAESAALLISMSGHHRLAFETSWGMAHHFSTAMEGNYHDLMDSIKRNSLLDSAMRTLFKGHAKVTDADLDSLILGRQNTWLSAQDMLDMGMIDTIVSSRGSLKKRIMKIGTKKALKISKQSRSAHR